MSETTEEPASAADNPAPVRQWLDARSWVDVWRGWRSDEGGAYRELASTLPWTQARLWRYDHYVTEPRLGTSVTPAAHPVLKEATLLLRSTYGVDFMGPALAYYRDGRDALGAHRDRDLRYTSQTLVAILTFGSRRPWQLTPLASAAGSRPRIRGDQPGMIDLLPADGDLFVLGGRAQADWLHGVPPVPGLHTGRISAQWRWTSRTGPPERGPGYRAPRNFSGN
ncbi:MAG TPA: alpha-ketoglutarate-dependent dioxygenase AlkB [Frankiaceae bacterium]|nr:alpha-ketoglutarate-dependent dioxygenase AlkB [Frankiaceae bacterium]